MVLMHSTLPDPPFTAGPHRILQIEAIAGDASSRRYWRVLLDDHTTAVLCQYHRAAVRELAHDLEVLKWLAEAQLPVPRIMAAVPAHRIVLLEDGGATDGEAALAALPSSQRPATAQLFLAPLALLSKLSPQNLPKWNRPLDKDFVRWELAGFELWALHYRLSTKPTPRLTAALDDLALSLAHHPRRICLRDYHLNNILIDQAENVRVIDVQDILIGPDTYDLASLVGDRAMPDLVDETGLALLQHRWAELTCAESGWQHRLTEVRLQRALKVLGTFCRLQARGAQHYGRWIPKQASAAHDHAQRLDMPPELCRSLLDLAALGG